MSDCNFVHKNVDTLYGIRPTSIDNLPHVCNVCGEKITYSDNLVFVSFPTYPNIFCNGDGEVIMISETFCDINIDKKGK